MDQAELIMVVDQCLADLRSRIMEASLPAFVVRNDVRYFSLYVEREKVQVVLNVTLGAQK